MMKKRLHDITRFVNTLEHFMEWERQGQPVPHMVVEGQVALLVKEASALIAEAAELQRAHRNIEDWRRLQK